MSITYNSLDFLIVGNDYGAEIRSGRLDAFNGGLLLGNGQGEFRGADMLESGFVVSKNAKTIAKIIDSDQKELILVGQNKNKLLVYEKEYNNVNHIKLKSQDAYAIINLVDGSSYKELLPYGHTFLSQSARRLSIGHDAISCEIFDYQGNSRKISL